MLSRLGVVYLLALGEILQGPLMAQCAHTHIILVGWGGVGWGGVGLGGVGWGGVGGGGVGWGGFGVGWGWAHPPRNPRQTAKAFALAASPLIS